MSVRRMYVCLSPLTNRDTAIEIGLSSAHLDRHADCQNMSQVTLTVDEQRPTHSLAASHRNRHRSSASRRPSPPFRHRSICMMSETCDLHPTWRKTWLGTVHGRNYQKPIAFSPRKAYRGVVDFQVIFAIFFGRFRLCQTNGADSGMPKSTQCQSRR